jgi:hypothetical protein
MSSGSRRGRSSNQRTEWEVIEIVAEDGKLFQVRWAGNDPETGKPWPLDWIPSSHCSTELVRSWERKKGELSRIYNLDSFTYRITQRRNARRLLQCQLLRRRRLQELVNDRPGSAMWPVSPNLRSPHLASASTASTPAPRMVWMKILCRPGDRNLPTLSMVQTVVAEMASLQPTRSRVQVKRIVLFPRPRYLIPRSKR